jgi:beta-barrel assembly-enhancing protease
MACGEEQEMTRIAAVLSLVMAGAGLICGGGPSREIEVFRSDLAVQADEAEKWFHRQGLVITDSAAQSYINQVAKKIGKSGPQDSTFRILLITVCEPNAVSFANGLLVLCSGVFTVIDNETQLAFLLAHEMAHYDLNHHLQERYNLHQKTVDLLRGQIVGSIFLGGLAALGAEKSLRYMLCGFSRELEKEADRVALDRIVKAGYDPANALLLFQNLRTRTGKDTLEETDYQTHPSLSERISLGSNYLASIKLPAAYSAPDAAVFQRSFSRVCFANAQECLSQSEYGSALRSADFCLNQYPASPGALTIKADVFLTRRNPPDIDSAAIFYHKAIFAESTFAPAYRGLGCCYFLMGERDSARGCFEHYLQAAPQANDTAYMRFYMGYFDAK